MQLLINFLYGLPLLTIMVLLATRVGKGGWLLCGFLLLSLNQTYSFLYIPQLGLHLTGMQLSYFAILILPITGIPFSPSKKALLLIGLVVSTCVVTIMLRRHDFTPVMAYEFDVEARQGFSFLTMKTQMPSSVYTRSLYLIASLCMYFTISSLKISLRTKLRCIDSAIYYLTIVGVIQVIMYYTNSFDLYINSFYNCAALTGNETIRLPYQVAYGIKRMNGTMMEPSIFAYAISFLGICRYLLAKQMSGSVYTSIIIAIASTATTFVLMIASWACIWISTLRDKSTNSILLAYSAVIGAVVVLACTGIVSTVADERGDSFNERFERSFVAPVENWKNHPFFGYGYGTDRALFLPVDLLESFGLVGVTLLAVGIAFLTKGRMRKTLFFVFIYGFAVPDITMPFLWFLLGFMESQDAPVVQPSIQTRRHGRVAPRRRYAVARC